MIRVLIVDDDSFIRESLKVLIGLDAGIEVAGTAGDGREALSLLGSPAERMLYSWTSGCRDVTGWKVQD